MLICLLSMWLLLSDGLSRWHKTMTACLDRSHIYSVTTKKSFEVNREFLRHDYYTDIITFDYSRSRMVSGDMFISLDTVASNARLVGCEYQKELMRVIIHGVLHLCGINDKGPGEREIMEAHEDQALALLNGQISVI